ncbi:hypothetical protein Hanom_Chr02g00143341 [Helianthus anomalus]
MTIVQVIHAGTLHKVPQRNMRHVITSRVIPRILRHMFKTRIPHNARRGPNTSRRTFCINSLPRGSLTRLYLHFNSFTFITSGNITVMTGSFTPTITFNITNTSGSIISNKPFTTFHIRLNIVSWRGQTNGPRRRRSGRSNLRNIH